MPVRPFCCSSVFFFFRLTHQYSIDLTVCLRAITNHPRNSFQSVRVGPEPGQKWSKTAEESERDTERRLSGPNYIQSLKIGKVQSERERSSWWEQEARWAEVVRWHFWLCRDYRFLETCLCVSVRSALRGERIVERDTDCRGNEKKRIRSNKFKPDKVKTKSIKWSKTWN